MDDNIIVREATIADIDLLVEHHSAMFREIMEIENKRVDEDAFSRMAESYRKKLSEQLLNMDCKAWIVLQKEEYPISLASAGVSILNMVPTPSDDSYVTAYIHSVYTEKNFRKNGYGELVVKMAIDYAKKRGINRIYLAASSAGKPLYEKLGFYDMKSMMRLEM